MNERKILIGMITNTDYLRGIYDEFKEAYFDSKVAATIGRFCVDFYKKNKVAPDRNIDDLVDQVSSNPRSTKDEVEDLEDILDSLSDELDDAESTINVAYLTDKTLEHFSIQKAKDLIRSLERATELNDSKKATDLIASYKHVKKEDVVGINIFDDEVIDKAFSDSSNGIINIDNDFGVLFNPETYPESFIALLAQAKVGKTWILSYIAYQALQQGLKVALFQAGDMSTERYARRFYTTTARKNITPKYCEAHHQAVIDCVHNQAGSCPIERLCKNKSGETLFIGDTPQEVREKTKEEVINIAKQNKGYTPCSVCKNRKQHKSKFLGTPFFEYFPAQEPLTNDEIKRIKSQKKFKPFRDNFQLFTYPANTLTCNEISSRLDSLEEEGFTPDVLLVDYADIMAANARTGSPKEKSESIFIDLRKISQERKVCLVTPTQADADALEKETLTNKNFSDNVGKLRHVTSIFTLNQTPEDKRKNMMRIAKTIARDDEFDPNKQVVALQDLAIGEYMLDTFWR